MWINGNLVGSGFSGDIFGYLFEVFVWFVSLVESWGDLFE